VIPKKAKSNYIPKATADPRETKDEKTSGFDSLDDATSSSPLHLHFIFKHFLLPPCGSGGDHLSLSNRLFLYSNVQNKVLNGDMQEASLDVSPVTNPNKNQKTVSSNCKKLIPKTSPSPPPFFLRKKVDSHFLLRK